MARADSPSGSPLLQVRNLVREYPAGGEPVAVLKNIDLDVYAGEMLAIIGASGSGKSTLMNILGCLTRPRVAAIWWRAKKPARWSLTSWRACAASTLVLFFSATT